MHLLASEQVLDGNLLELAKAGTAGHHVGQPRHGAEWKPGCFASLDHALHLRTAGRRHGDEQHLRCGLACKFAHLVKRTQHRYAANPRSAQLRVVIQHADHEVAVFAHQPAHQGVTGPPRAQHQHAHGRRAR